MRSIAMALLLLSLLLAEACGDDNERDGTPTPTVEAAASDGVTTSSPTTAPTPEAGNTSLRRYELRVHPRTFFPDPQTLPEMNCRNVSLSTGRTDAFRCMTESLIYDPCFLTNDDTMVVCPEDPREEESVFIARWGSDGGDPSSVRGDFDAPERPWFLVLDAPGDPSCRFLTGATAILPGERRMDFDCEAPCTSPYETDAGDLAVDCYPGFKVDSSEEELLAVETVRTVLEAWY